jgi:hypothetical protein
MINKDKNSTFGGNDRDHIVLETCTLSMGDDGRFSVSETQSSMPTSGQAGQYDMWGVKVTSDGYNEFTTYPEAENYLVKTGIFSSVNDLSGYMHVNVPFLTSDQNEVGRFITSKIEDLGMPRNFEIIVKYKDSSSG